MLHGEMAPPEEALMLQLCSGDLPDSFPSPTWLHSSLNKVLPQSYCVAELKRVQTALLCAFPRLPGAAAVAIKML